MVIKVIGDGELISDIKNASDWSYSTSAYASPHIRLLLEMRDVSSIRSFPLVFILHFLAVFLRSQRSVPSGEAIETRLL